MPKSQATAAVRAVHAELPLPQAPSWSGYWTFVSAAIIVMFVLYLAQKGTLSTWLKFFYWTNPAPLSTTAAPASSGSASTTANTPIPGTTTPGTPGLTLNPFAGLPFGLGQSLGVGLPTGQGGAANPSTGANSGLGN